MFCQHCGKQIPDGAVFCSFCGARQGLETRETRETTQARRPAAPVQKQKPKRGGGKGFLTFLCVLVAFAAAYGIARFAFPKEQTPEPSPTPAPTEEPQTDIAVPEGVPIIVNANTVDDPDTYDGTEYKRRELAFAAEVDEALREMQPEICVISLLPLEHDTLGLYYGYPYFWIKSYTAVGRRGKWEGKNVTYYEYSFTYTQDASRKEAMQAQVDQARERYLSLIPEGADVWEASRVLHDELIRRVSYDQTLKREHCRDIYGALVEESAVCQGYAYAFSYLMHNWAERAGIDADALPNEYPTVVSEDHAWNVAAISAAYDTNLDVTWDDIDKADRNGEPYIMYNYFGMTEEEISRIDSHAAISANDAEVEYLFEEEYPFNYYKHEGYYLTEFDREKIASIFAEQMEKGSNLLTVRFEREEDYQQIQTWVEDEQKLLNELLNDLGYEDAYYYWTVDDSRTFSVGLYAPLEE